MANYDSEQLSWNTAHTINRQGQYCYCGHDRRLDELSLQCKGTDPVVTFPPKIHNEHSPKQCTPPFSLLRDNPLTTTPTPPTSLLISSFRLSQLVSRLVHRSASRTRRPLYHKLQVLLQGLRPQTHWKKPPATGVKGTWISP